MTKQGGSSTLQHTATLCNTLLQHTAAHCSTLQHTATEYYSTLQHTATHCNTLQLCVAPKRRRHSGNTLQHTSTHCNTMQHNATHCNTLQHTRYMSSLRLDARAFEGRIGISQFFELIFPSARKQQVTNMIVRLEQVL